MLTLCIEAASIPWGGVFLFGDGHEDLGIRRFCIWNGEAAPDPLCIVFSVHGTCVDITKACRRHVGVAVGCPHKPLLGDVISNTAYFPVRRQINVHLASTKHEHAGAFNISRGAKFCEGLFPFN